VTTKFKNSVTRGFAAVEEPTVAVCVLPGTEIAFEREVEYRHSLLPNQKVAERLARFRQINMEQASVHHDALEFPNGKIILLARLCEGQHATVLQLPASPRATNETEQQKRGSLVTLSAARYRACLAAGAIEKSHRGADGSSTARARQQNRIAEEVPWPYGSFGRRVPS